MDMSRRNFLKTSSLTLAGTAFFPKGLLASSVKTAKGKVGLQLYTVRDDMMEDPKRTLEALAEMGFTYLEHANYMDRKFYGYKPKEFKKLLSDLGLKMPSGHVGLGLNHWDSKTNDFTDEWKYAVEDAAIVGQDYLVSPSMDEDTRTEYDKLQQLLEMFNKSGELCAKSDVLFS